MAYQIMLMDHTIIAAGSKLEKSSVDIGLKRMSIAKQVIQEAVRNISGKLKKPRTATEMNDRTYQ